MNSLSKLPIALSFFIVTMMTGLVVGLFSFGLSYFEQKEVLKETRLQEVQQRLVELQGTINDFNRRENHRAITREVSRLTSNKNLRLILIVGADGFTYHASRPSLRGISLSSQPDVLNTLEGLDSTQPGKVWLTPDDSTVVGAFPVEPLSLNSTEKILDSAYLYAEFDLSHDIEVLRYRHQQELFYTWGVLFIILSLGFSVLYFGFKQKIRQILTGTRRLTHGQYAYRINLKEKNEFGLIAKSIDRMAASLESKNRQLTVLAEQDSLTGLTNRYKFYRLLEKRIHAYPNKMFALLFIDLDRFKIINDTLGHQTGDEYLKVIGGRLLEKTSSKDIVSRFGGDEFVLCLEEVSSKAEIQTKTEVLLKTLSKQVEVNGQNLFTSASVGISLFPQDGRTIHELIKAADIAMYQVKSQDAMAMSFYQESFDHNTLNYLSFRTYIKQSIEAGEVYPLFQPQVDARTQKIVGFEALARMKDETGNWISPAQFIPVIEENGWMVEFSNVMYRNAMSEFQDWLTEQKPKRFPSLSLNLSIMQINHMDFLSNLDKLLEQFKMISNCLELEITEGIFIGNIESKLPILEAIKARGIQIAIDDFGTGYSSLSYLKKLPLDRLKIDQSFVRDINVDLNDNAIIETIIAMASKLGLEVVSEGVETEQQLTFLRAQDCHIIQGYLTGRPGSLPRSNQSKVA